MSLLTLGMAEELSEYNIAVNSLWPKTTIATAAIEFAVGDKHMLNSCRTVNIMADSAYEILQTKNLLLTGQLLLDEDVLKKAGINDFNSYAYNKDYINQLHPDLFID